MSKGYLVRRAFVRECCKKCYSNMTRRYVYRPPDGQPKYKPGRGLIAVSKTTYCHNCDEPPETEKQQT